MFCVPIMVAHVDPIPRHVGFVQRKQLMRIYFGEAGQILIKIAR